MQSIKFVGELFNMHVCARLSLVNFYFLISETNYTEQNIANWIKTKYLF